jgi:hypothetical protein
MIANAISLSLLLLQPSGPRPPVSAEREGVTAELYAVICNPLPDLSVARNSELFYYARVLGGRSFTLSEREFGQIDRQTRERLVAEEIEKARLREIADFPRLNQFIVTNLNRYGDGETARNVVATLQPAICR